MTVPVKVEIDGKKYYVGAAYENFWGPDKKQAEWDIKMTEIIRNSAAVLYVNGTMCALQEE